MSAETATDPDRGSWLSRYAAKTWTAPFPQALPSDAERYASNASKWRVAWRRALREANLASHGQSVLERGRIDPTTHRRILWIHKGTPQVGDSLMDLAARVLVRGRVERIDLLTDEHLLGLYRHDEVFSQVASTADALESSYDLVLLHSTSSRSLKEKFRHYRRTPFAHIQGFYTGPEFNRTLFGFYRMAQLLALPTDTGELNRMAKPSMWPGAEEVAVAARVGVPQGSLGLALGGVRDWRTYTRWVEVLRHLHGSGMQAPVLLLGADNGLALRDEIVQSVAGLRFIDRVGQHSLGEVQALMRRCGLVLCADGGLLHVAHTAGVPVLALFAGIIEPRFRVTAANRTICLHGAERVDDIPPDDVAISALEALAGPASLRTSTGIAQPIGPS